MKAINNLSLDGRVEICSISQSQYQFDNYSVTLYELDGKKYIVEDLINDANYYEIEQTDDISNPLEFVKQVASDWAGNADETDLEMMRWNLRDASDFEVAEDFEGTCKIVVERNFFGYSPIDYLQEDMSMFPRIFDTRQDAQDYINEQKSGIYYTLHNEAGSPSYTIVAA